MVNSSLLFHNTIQRGVTYREEKQIDVWLGTARQKGVSEYLKVQLLKRTHIIKIVRLKAGDLKFLLPRTDGLNEPSSTVSAT